MRNGNLPNNLHTDITIDGSYPTYEEWKQYNLLVSFSNKGVLILPMRNGNGVETAFGSQATLVLILPMRNGNNLSFIEMCKCESVLILPMRNGNLFSSSL